jgi:hypothetical protein
MPRAAYRIGDRAVPGAAAEIAFERPGQRHQLRLIEAGGGQDHAGGAEAALEPLGGEELRLHRVGRAIPRRQPFDRGDLSAFGTMRRIKAGVHRLAVDPDRAGAAIAAVAGFLDPEPARFPQIIAQTLPGARGGRNSLIVDLDRHGKLSSCRISSATGTIRGRARPASRA